MEPEKGPSSPSQSSLLPLALLGILAVVSWFRAKSETPIQQSVKPVQAQDSTDGNRSIGKNENDVSAGTVAAPEIPETATESDSAENRRQNVRRLRKAGADWISLLTLLAVVGYAAVARNQWREMIHSNSLTQQALVIGQRPWIKIRHRIVKPLNFEFQGAGGPAAEMTVEDTLENVGNSVALNVVSWEDVIPVDSGLSTRTALKRRDEWCNANKQFDPKSPTTLNGTILSPRDPFVQDSRMGPLMSTVQKAAEANTLDLGHLHRGTGANPLAGKVAFVMIGCVVYRSSFEPDGTRPWISLSVGRA